MLDKRHKTLSEKALHNSIPHLILFKDILIKIKYTVELLTMIRVILSLISNIAFIPIFVLAIWLLIGKVYILFSVLFTSTLVSAYLTNHYDYISKTADFLSKFKEVLRGISIRTHNWLFADDLISKAEMVKSIDKIESKSILMGKAGSYFDYAHGYLSSVSQYINWSYAGYTGATLLTLTAGYALYTANTTGASSIYNGVKALGSAIWGFMSYFGSGPLDPPNGGISIKWHNWVFNDDLISKVEVDRVLDSFQEPTSVSLINKAGSYFNYEYLSSMLPTLPSLQEGFNWHIVGYTCASLLIVTSSYLLYTGVISLDPASVHQGIKKVGSSLWSLMSYFGFGPLDKPDADDSKGPSSFITEVKKYTTNLQLKSSNAIEFKKINEAFILDTLTEMSQLSGLKLEMIKIRLTYLNKEGKKSNKLVVTFLVSQRFTASLLFDKMYDNCSILGIDLKSIIKVKLDLILIPVPLRIKPKTLLNTTFKVIEVILNIIEFLFTIPPSII